MRHRAASIALLVMLSCSGQVLARLGEENVIYAYAQVLRASPVYETLRTLKPEHRCDGPAESNSNCHTVQVEQEQRLLTGYDVEYQYKGEKYMSRMARDPGKRVRIRIAVAPDQPAD